MSKSHERKPIPPAYAFWRRRIEGQIRHTIHEHPEWFNLPDAETQDRCVRSTAKRIIGEIVAGTRPGDSAGGGATGRAVVRGEAEVQVVSAAAGEGGGTGTAALRSDSTEAV
jgi:hypothetical protein